jgi:hypothetical protein
MRMITMPLPKVMYSVDQYNDGRFIVTKVVDGTPVEEVGRYSDVEEAKAEAIRLQSEHIVGSLFPAEDYSCRELVDITRGYFQELLRILPQNGDAQQARLLVRQAFNFAKTAIMMDGLV